MNYELNFKKSFSERLINTLQINGFTSRRGTNEVNGQQFANFIGVSLPMARRYINGKSIPTNKNLHKIGELLNIDPCWLLYGEGDNDFINIDKETIEKIFINFFDLLCNKNITKEQYMLAITNCIDIYHNVLDITPDEKKEKTILLMSKFLLPNNSKIRSNK